MSSRKTVVALLSLIGLGLLSSCEALLYCDGYVYSAHSKKPLRGARVELLSDGYQFQTVTVSDSTGSFHIGRMVGAVFGVPSRGVLIYHPGYNPLLIPNLDKYHKWKKSPPDEEPVFYLTPESHSQ
jgi:hypothetical protein